MAQEVYTRASKEAALRRGSGTRRRARRRWEARTLPRARRRWGAERERHESGEGDATQERNGECGATLSPRADQASFGNPQLSVYVTASDRENLKRLIMWNGGSIA
jgi:hypothetical protein